MNGNTLPGSPAPVGVGLRNGPDEERYIEGQVLVEKGSDIGGAFVQPGAPPVEIVKTWSAMINLPKN